METPVRRPRWRRRVLVLLLLALLAVWLGRSWLMAPAVPEGSHVLLTLTGEYPETPPDSLLGRVVGGGPMPMVDLVSLIRDAREDSRVAGLVVRVRSLAVGWAKAQEIRDALIAFRDAGKSLVAYLEGEFGGGTLDYYVASAAKTIYLSPGASAPLNGLAAQYSFLGGVWEKLDIDVQVEKIREYKTAGDFIGGKQMTPYHREMANAILDSVYQQLVTDIAGARDLRPEAVRAAVDRCPITAGEFAALKLADGEKYLDEVRTELIGADREFVDAERYRGAAGVRTGLGGRKVAVVFGAGTITSGESGGGMWQDGIIGSDTIAKAFQQAAEDDAVKAIVFRVDSPGGSALASDLIWRATQKARAAKPVIVSMSDVAASGGYYAAAGATRIFAQPGTLTGSIGVVAWKPNVAGFLARLGVNTETLVRGKFARLHSFTNSLTEGERERVVAAMTHVYDLFLSRVAAGRGLSVKQVDEVGRGRVWTGEQARANGLVDQFGGLTAAIAAAKAEAGIPESEKVPLVFYPKRKPLLERLTNLLQARVVAAMPQWWQQLRALMPAYDFPEGSVLTLMPGVFDIR